MRGTYDKIQIARFVINFLHARSDSLKEFWSKTSKRDYDKAYNKKAAFKKFLTGYVFTESSVMLLPVGDPETPCKDKYFKSI